MRVAGIISCRRRCRGLADEAKRLFDNGYAYFKLKVGGAPESTDLGRIHAAIEVAEAQALLRWTPTVCSVVRRVRPAGRPGPLRAWLDRRACCSLDFNGLAGCAGSLDTPIATGENIFSEADAANLLLFGGLRPVRINYKWILFLVMA